MTNLSRSGFWIFLEQRGHVTRNDRGAGALPEAGLMTITEAGSSVEQEAWTDGETP